jgi:hypothetical protein
MRSKKDAYYGLAIITIIPLFIGWSLVALAYWGLLEPRTIISTVVPELAIALFLYFIFDHRRNKVEELLSLMDVSEKFSHLNIYMVKVIHSAISYGYVENTLTKKVFRLPDFLGGAIESGVIPIVAEFANMDEFVELVKQKGLTLIDRKPSFSELKVIEQKRAKKH